MATRVIPSKDGHFLSWLGNLALKLPGYAAVLGGIAAADLTQLAADYAMFGWIMGVLDPVDAAKQQFTAFKNLVRDGDPAGVGSSPSTDAPAFPTLPAAPANVPFGIVRRCASLVTKIHDSPGYTPAIGEDLQVVTTPPTVLTHPVGEATALPASEVELTWVKGTHQAVIVESQRGSETAWTDLGPKFSKPWIDDRPPLVAGQPEVRRYRLRFQDHDEPFGNYSDVLTVTTRP